jgi:hypothetical protein
LDEIPFDTVQAHLLAYRRQDNQYIDFVVSSHSVFLGRNSRASVQLSAQSLPEEILYPSQNYIGTWYTDEHKLDSLTILDISSGTITFEMGVFRLMGMEAVARVKDNQIEFIAIGGSNTSLNGTLEFKENSIVVTFAESDFIYIEAGTTFTFRIKG